MRDDQKRALLADGGKGEAVQNVMNIPLDAAAAMADYAFERAQELHPATVDLVRRFSEALISKLSSAEKKYGYSDAWLSPDWMDECRAELMRHIDKGDPRDVAAYCAFLWHHNEPTAAPTPERADAFPYQKTFDAIAAATSISGGHIAISVAKFQEAFGTVQRAQPTTIVAQGVMGIPPNPPGSGSAMVDVYAPFRTWRAENVGAIYDEMKRTERAQEPAAVQDAIEDVAKYFEDCGDPYGAKMIRKYAFNKFAVAKEPQP